MLRVIESEAVKAYYLAKRIPYLLMRNNAFPKAEA